MPVKTPPEQVTEPEAFEISWTYPLGALVALLAAVLIWSNWTAFNYLIRRWWNDADYTYGFFVPLFSVYLLWRRREMASQIRFRGSAWGLALIAVAALIRWGSSFYFLRLLEPISIVPCLAGVALFIGGWAAIRWAWPSILFLAFMVPVPSFIANTLSQPLQRIGSLAGTFVIQLLGIPSVARGNVIVLPSTELGVAEACNGLPMMMLFFAVCFGAVFLSNRTWLEKGIMLLAAAPIAVIANVIRIATTGVLYEWGGQGLGDAVYHDLAGWFMMPLAVVLLWGLLWVLDHALVEKVERKPLFDGASGKKRTTS